VVHPDTDEVVRLELGTGRVVARIKLGPLPFQVAPDDDRFLPSLVAVGAGAGSVASGRGAVARIDAATDRVREIVPTGLPIGLAAAAGAVWVPDRRGSLVYRLVRDDLLIEVEAVAVVASFQPMTATAPA